MKIFFFNFSWVEEVGLPTLGYDTFCQYHFPYPQPHPNIYLEPFHIQLKKKEPWTQCSQTTANFTGVDSLTKSFLYNRIKMEGRSFAALISSIYSLTGSCHTLQRRRLHEQDYNRCDQACPQHHCQRPWIGRGVQQSLRNHRRPICEFSVMIQCAIVIFVMVQCYRQSCC